MQELEARNGLSDRQNDICRPTNCIDPVVAGMLGIYSRTAVVARLPRDSGKAARRLRGLDCEESPRRRVTEVVGNVPEESAILSVMEIL